VAGLHDRQKISHLKNSILKKAKTPHFEKQFANYWFLSNFVGLLSRGT